MGVGVGVGAVAVEAIKSVHGKAYQYGPSGPTLYVSSGGSNDYTYGALNVTYSYVVELRDTGTPPHSHTPHATRHTPHATRTDDAECRSLWLCAAAERDRPHW